MQEVTGSIPVTSTKTNGAGPADPIFLDEYPEFPKSDGGSLHSILLEFAALKVTPRPHRLEA